jgi:hypothetical protein
VLKTSDYPTERKAAQKHASDTFRNNDVKIDDTKEIVQIIQNYIKETSSNMTYKNTDTRILKY